MALNLEVQCRASGYANTADAALGNLSSASIIFHSTFGFVQSRYRIYSSLSWWEIPHLKMSLGGFLYSVLFLFVILVKETPKFIWKCHISAKNMRFYSSQELWVCSDNEQENILFNLDSWIANLAGEVGDILQLAVCKVSTFSLSHHRLCLWGRWWKDNNILNPNKETFYCSVVSKLCSSGETEEKQRKQLWLPGKFLLKKDTVVDKLSQILTVNVCPLHHIASLPKQIIFIVFLSTKWVLCNLDFYIPLWMTEKRRKVETAVALCLVILVFTKGILVRKVSYSLDRPERFLAWSPY